MMYIKREIPFDTSKKEEFIAVMLELGYFLHRTPNKEHLIFRKRILQLKGDSTRFLKKLSPMDSVYVWFRNDKATLRTNCGKILLTLAILNVLVASGLYLAGISLPGILFLAVLFFVLENLMVLFWVNLNFDQMVAKTGLKPTI